MHVELVKASLTLYKTAMSLNQNLTSLTKSMCVSYHEWVNISVKTKMINNVNKANVVRSVRSS